MASSNDKIRRWLGWSVVLLLVIGTTGWFGYRAIAESRREESRQLADAENLRRARYWEAVDELLLIGDAGDEVTQKRCRHALKMLELLEPGWYSTWMLGPPRKERAWMSEPLADKR